MASPLPPGRWLRAATVVLVLNVLFSLSLLWQAALPTEPLRQKVRQAFAVGELVQEDYLREDYRRGANQYNDCLILQLMTNDDYLTSKAFGPVIYFKDETYSMYCATLFELAVEKKDVELYMSARYSRYWHGYVPVSAAMLQVFDLGEIRQGLKLAVYGALILLVLSAGRPHGLLMAAGVVAIMGVLFWAIPYFGQSLCHGLGDAFVILGLAGLLFWRGWLSRPAAFIPFCAAYGAGVVYLEFLTGLLPTAAGLLFPFAYLVAISRSDGGTPAYRAFIFALTGLAAFALGGLATVAMKQTLSFIFADHDAVRTFAGNFIYYASGVSDDTRAGMLSNYITSWPFDIAVSRMFLPGWKMLRSVDVLTYGNRPAGLLLCAASGLAWMAAGCLAFLRRNEHLAMDFLAFAVGVGIVFAWVVVFPTHTFAHAPFMVRILIVPIALGWAALLWQLYAGREFRRSPTRAISQPRGSRSEGGV